jgi:thioesterase domain-containing protein
MMDFETARLTIESALPYVKKLGVKLLRFEPYRVELILPFDLSNTNHLGALHAGALYTFAETVGGAFLLSTGIVEGVLVVRRGAIEYFKPVTGDLLGRAVAEEKEVKGWLDRFHHDQRVEMPLKIELLIPPSTPAALAEILYYMKAPRPG